MITGERLCGNVYPRKDSPFLWIWYRDAEGRRRHVPTEFTPREKGRARALLEEILRQVAAGETPAASPGSTAVLIERWLADRKARGKRSAAHEAARMREYVIPRLGSVPADELRSTQVRDPVHQLAQLPSPRGGRLAARTVLHVYRTLRQVFTDAVADEVLAHNPVVVKRGDLPAKLDKDPPWREGAVFTAAEVALLLYDRRIPEDRRVLYAIEFLGGLRTGEAAARRWQDWEPTRQPLGGLLVETSYDTRTRTEGPTKTKRPRRVPVHPLTAEMLLGVGGGGRKDVLRWITHSPGDIIDEYTTLPWEALCGEVLKISIQSPAPAEGKPRLVAVAAGDPVTSSVTLLGEGGPEKAEAPETVAVSGAPEWRGVGDSKGSSGQGLTGRRRTPNRS